MKTPTHLIIALLASLLCVLTPGCDTEDDSGSDTGGDSGRIGDSGGDTDGSLEGDAGDLTDAARDSDGDDASVTGVACGPSLTCEPGEVCLARCLCCGIDMGMGGGAASSEYTCETPPESCEGTPASCVAEEEIGCEADSDYSVSCLCA